jgi:hypothetical protein
VFWNGNGRNITLRAIDYHWRHPIFTWCKEDTFARGVQALARMYSYIYSLKLVV